MHRGVPCKRAQGAAAPSHAGGHGWQHVLPGAAQQQPVKQQYYTKMLWLQVACTEREFPLNELKVQPHQAMLEAMAGSVFCLVLPGNSQSSQRLTEAFITGCIPVFLGPPWHTLPFSAEVRVPQNRSCSIVDLCAHLVTEILIRCYGPGPLCCNKEYGLQGIRCSCDRQAF